VEVLLKVEVVFPLAEDPRRIQLLLRRVLRYARVRRHLVVVPRLLRQRVQRRVVVRGYGLGIGGFSGVKVRVERAAGVMRVFSGEFNVRFRGCLGVRVMGSRGGVAGGGAGEMAPGGSATDGYRRTAARSDAASPCGVRRFR
jgi:hypothetical protein